MQRLDGPVRGNSKIITELSKEFTAAGWNVVNLIWGRRWDELIEKDKDGLLQSLMDETVDGEYQNFKAKGGAYTRERFFGKNAETKKMVDALSDEEIENLNRGGHDPTKVYNAYKRAYSEKNRPTVILAFTVKGYGIGSIQADNATHQVKKLSDDAIKNFIDTFNLPVKFNETSKLDYLTLDKESKKYLIDRRKELGGFLPSRKCNLTPLAFSEDNFDVFMGAFEKELSTTMIFVRILTKLLRDKEFGSRVVPIVPDEARTFGMDSLLGSLVFTHPRVKNMSLKILIR